VRKVWGKCELFCGRSQTGGICPRKCRNIRVLLFEVARQLFHEPPLPFCR
jgi:hypothetical protein